jgi:hypothetical protein
MYIIACIYLQDTPIVEKMMKGIYGDEQAMNLLNMTTNITFIGYRGINFITLTGGSQYEKGFAYGKNMRADLLGARDHLVEKFSNHNVSYNEMSDMAQKFFDRYSNNYKPFLRGISDGAEISTDDVNILNGMETLLGLLYSSTSEDTLVHCSYFTIPTTESATGSLTLGRNYDFSPEIYGEIAKNLTVTIINDLIPTAIIGMPGQIYCPTCINQKGLFIELNNGMPSGGSYANQTRQSMLINMLEVMQNSESLEELNSRMMPLESDYSLIINAANETHLLSYEYSSSSSLGMKPYSPTPGYHFVSTNFYLNNSWNTPAPTDESTWHGVTRRNNLIDLLNSEDCFDLESIKSMMGKTIKDGGAAWDHTLYQIIFQPTTNDLYLKISGEEWVDIEMGELYDSTSHIVNLTGDYC